MSSRSGKIKKGKMSVLHCHVNCSASTYERHTRRLNFYMKAPLLDGLPVSRIEGRQVVIEMQCCAIMHLSRDTHRCRRWNCIIAGSLHFAVGGVKVTFLSRHF